jgi:hypothetical protein
MMRRRGMAHRERMGMPVEKRRKEGREGGGLSSFVTWLFIKEGHTNPKNSPLQSIDMLFLVMAAGKLVPSPGDGV